MTTWPDPDVAAGLAAVGQAQPLVHCLTNIVVAGFTANVLLAIGASPAMVENAEESAAFASIAGAVLVNLGTLSEERDRAMLAAAAGAHDGGRPWVLDPVAVGALEHRTALARRLLEHSPAIVRGNASEIMSLAGVTGSAGRGVDSVAGSVDAVDAASALARERGTVVAVSGAVDYVTDGQEVVEVPGGHLMMTRVTGVGCALGGMMAAFAGAGADPMRAAAGASAVLAAAGQRAASPAGASSGAVPGPGSFAVRLLDELWDLAAAASDSAAAVSSSGAGASPAATAPGYPAPDQQR
ncbi:MAG TPA: hydroxyethylthiazole kinase [Acidimicrobiales bacterium]|nr:hydroxyethylthiazole kinase [Acidimicrobiales bacterium]